MPSIHNLYSTAKDIFSDAKSAKFQTGKSIPKQFSEIQELRGFAGRCGANDYYNYGLYKDDYLHGRGREDFVGWRVANELSLALNPRHAVLPAWDKCVFTQLADSAGLPVIKNIACFHPSPKISNVFGLHLKNMEEAKSFLESKENYPLFGKPAYSQQGIGSCYITHFSEKTKLLYFLDGKSMSIDSFSKRLFSSVDIRYHKPECGFLFQTPLSLPKELENFTKWKTISSLRIICLNSPDGAFPIRAIWKISTPPNHMDNFSEGKNGNLMANVDLATGGIGPLIDNIWPSAKLHNVHPQSNIPVSGFILPRWNEILDICKQAGRSFPLMKIHHWDIALSDTGPRILELNDLGGLRIAQVHGWGMLAHGARNFIKEHGNSDSFVWIKDL